MKILTTLFLSAISSVILAQIPNPSFENWNGGNPVGWLTENNILPGFVTQSSDAYAGSYAARLNCQLNGGAFLVTGNSSSAYFYNSSNPVALNGWYILNAVSGDELFMTVGNKSGNTTVGDGIKSITASTAVYKEFSICITYGSGTADSATIDLQIINTGGPVNDSTYAIVDDLSWGSCVTGVDDISNNVTLEATYPNPANDICNIIFSIPAASPVNIALYDLNGRKVMNILDNSNLTSGRYKIPVDVNKLANGVYVYTITVDGVPYTQKLVVAK